jgi:hypothetical protein
VGAQESPPARENKQRQNAERSAGGHMTTVQLVGIAVAAAVVVLLVVALLVTRRRGRRAEQAPPGTSFLDTAPQDTLSGLGHAEAPVEDVTLDPEAVRALRATQPGPAPASEDDTLSPAPAVPEPQPATLEPPAVAAAPAAVAAGPPQDEDQEHPLSLDWGSPAEPSSPAEDLGVAIAAAAATGDPAEPPTVTSDAEQAPAEAPPQRPSRKVPLADIIVTTSRKVIDLEDPEVRRMLTDLVKYEIDQATRYREQGQNIDAVLQLTEAEKVSRALGMKDSADAIRHMMDDLRG